MALTAVRLREIEQIFEVIERFGVSREEVVIPLRPVSPGGVKRLPNGKLEILVDAAVPFDQYLLAMEARVRDLVGRGGE